MRTYLAFLAMPGVKRLLISAWPGRLAYNMIGLSTFFYVHGATNSLTVAGLAMGAETISSSLTAGLRGLAIDRLGQTKPLSAFVPMWVTALGFLTLQHTTLGILATCALIGISSPPINLSARPLWRAAVGPENLRTAYAIDTTMMNVATIAGPFAATALALNVSTSVALIATSACMLIGGVAMITMPLSRNWVPERPDQNAIRLWRHTPFVMLAIEGAIFGMGWGLLEVLVPSMSTQAGRPHLSAPMLGALALASVVGGLMTPALRRSVTPLRGFRDAQLLVAIAAAPLVLTSPGMSMGVCLTILGFILGFAQVYHWEVVEAVRPSGTASSAQAWLWSMEGTTVAIGSAVAGFMTDHHFARHALLLSSGCLALATAFVRLIATPWWHGADRPLSEVERAEALGDLEPAAE